MWHYLLLALINIWLALYLLISAWSQLSLQVEGVLDVKSPDKDLKEDDGPQKTSEKYVNSFTLSSWSSMAQSPIVVTNNITIIIIIIVILSSSSYYHQSAYYHQSSSSPSSIIITIINHHHHYHHNSHHQSSPSSL